LRNRPHSTLKIGTTLVTLVLLSCVAVRVWGFQSTETAIIQVKSKADATALCTQYGVQLTDSIPELNEYLVKGSAANLALLAKDKNVASIEYNVVVQISETTMLNESTVALLDPSTVSLLDGGSEGWSGGSTISSAMLHQAALQKIGFDASLALGSPTTVAVIDTGIDYLHPMLAGSTLPGHNFIDENRSADELLDLDPATAALLLARGNNPAQNGSTPAVLNPSTVAILDPALVALINAQPSKYFGHGTMVSGLIHVINPEALIMPLKVFDRTGMGTSFRIAKAVVYAAKQGVQVINMSFSLDSPSSLVDDALEFAAHQNVTLVASIGNSNAKVDKNYPSSYPRVIGVAATTLNDVKASFSNYGPAADVSAPGEALISPYPGGFYALWSGTSAAAALVSGEAALMWSHRDLSPGDITGRVRDKVDSLHDKYQLGKGRINLKSALHK
jgi:subtilisin family serine protease